VEGKGAIEKEAPQKQHLPPRGAKKKNLLSRMQRPIREKKRKGTTGGGEETRGPQNQKKAPIPMELAHKQN